VIIGHAQWFLDRLATHILAYEDDKRRRFGADATEPHRIKYQPITR
jgi:energy-dependent translational throttle protein EttA